MIMYKFGDIFEFRKKSKVKAGEGEIKGKFPFYTSSNVLNKYIDEYLFDGESLIFGTGGNASIHFARDKFNVSTDCLVAQTKNGKINTKFIYYFLLLNKHILEQGFKGAGLKHISKSYISNISIPEVDRTEQDKIVQVLDRVNDLRQKRKEQLTLLDDYLKSVFLEMFGDPIFNKNNYITVKIRQIVKDVKYGTSKKADTNNGKYSIIRMNNITYSGEWNFSNLKYIDLEENEKAKFMIKKGDLLFNRTNSKELVGKTAVYNRKEQMAFAGYLIRCRFNEKKASPIYVSHFLNSEYGKAKLFHMCKNIVGMANINAQELQDIEIILPPIELQIKFETIVNQTKELKQKMKESLNEMDNYFNSLMQRYF